VLPNGKALSIEALDSSGGGIGRRMGEGGGGGGGRGGGRLEEGWGCRVVGTCADSIMTCRRMAGEVEEENRSVSSGF